MASATSTASSDTLDCTNSLQPCNCTANQICVQIGRSGTQCARNTCVDRNTSSGSSGGKSSVGAVAGEAVGAVLGAILVLVAAYYFWRRRTMKARMAARAARASRSPNNHLKEFRIGAHKNGEKAADANTVTGPPGAGEEDATPVKRQSLRFDSNNHPLVTNRRSLSATNSALPLPSGFNDNPFGDHHSMDGNNSHVSLQDQAEGIRDGLTAPGHRDSQATVSEFSFRSSHSTNIIPIAYIPAHSNSNSIADLTSGPNEAYGQQSSSYLPRGSTFSRTLSSAAGSATNRNTIGYSDVNSDPANKPRSSRLSVPLSLRSSISGGLSDSVNGGGHFSSIFDRRASSASKNSNGLEIIAGERPTLNAGGRTTSPTTPSLPTPTILYTKDGKPIRPPRAPGLDLKLPTPEPKMSPSTSASLSPTSPSFPWSRNLSPTSTSFGILQAQQMQGRPTSDSPASSIAAHLLAPPGSANSLGTVRVGNGPPGSQRETLLSPTDTTRASGYSTFSATTGSSTGSHLSYILDPPQIVTPVSAGRVEVQVLGRAAAKTVKLPNGPLTGTSASGFLSHPLATQVATFPPSPLSRSNTLTRQGSSPVSDNPFDDEAAVTIEIPSSHSTPTMNQHTIPLTPTFGQSPLQTPQAGQEARPGYASGVSTRRDSDLSVFTSSSMYHGSMSHEDSLEGQPSLAGTDEVILDPPNRPFVPSYNGSVYGLGSDGSRHNSAAISTRSGYASVLDGIPFNLSLSPEPRHSQASSSDGGSGIHLGGNMSGRGSTMSSASSSVRHSSGSNIRDSAITFTSTSDLPSGRRDTSYSLSSEWNGAFAGMPIVMGGATHGEEAVPELPAQYKNAGTSAITRPEKDDKDNVEDMEIAKDDRYSTDSLAMAAAVARSFDSHN